MKPHEQQWQMKHNGGSPVIIDGNGKVLMHVVDVEAGLLALSAPGMVRALLVFAWCQRYQHDDCTTCDGCVAKAALQRAGVLP